MTTHPLRIAFFSNAPDGGVFRLGSHHLAREMSIRGHDVAHVSTPISLVEGILGREFRSARRWSKNPPLDSSRRDLIRRAAYRDQFGVLHTAPRPLIPARLKRESRAVRLILKRIGFDTADILIVDQLLFAGTVPQGSSKLIYRSTDNQASRRGLALEASMTASADALIACSPVVFDTFATNYSSTPTLLLENGVEGSFFAPISVGIDRGRKGAVYVGAIDHRFDWSFLIAAARANPREPFLIAGPVTTPSPAPLPANVNLLGPIAYEKVAELLGSARVGLLPLNDDVMNVGRSPMKFYEYLATGLYVSARSTPSLISRNGAPGVHLYESGAEGLEGLTALLRQGSENDAGRQFARQFDWSQRAEVLEQFLIDVLSDA